MSSSLRHRGPWPFLPPRLHPPVLPFGWRSSLGPNGLFQPGRACWKQRGDTGPSSPSLGGVLPLGGAGLPFSSAVSPARFPAAPWVVSSSFPSRGRSKRLLGCCPCWLGPCSSLARGCRSSPSLVLPCHKDVSMGVANTSRGANVWFRYVATKSNMARFPSGEAGGWQSRCGLSSPPSLLP